MPSSRRCSTSSPPPGASWTRAACRSSSRSTEASTVRPPRGPPPPAPTSSWPGAPSSTPTTPPRPPGRSARQRGPRRRDRVTLTAKVLTVSDGVADGSREDKSGVALVARLQDAGYEIAAHEVTRDGRDAVAGTLRTMTAGFAGLVVTTGGTGFGPRDLTPEGTRAVIEREAPGIAEAIRRASDDDGRGFGMLSRGVSGTRGRSLICNLPGSSSGASEGLDVVLPI